MMSAIRVLLLILGIFAVVFGATMYTVNQDFLESCPGQPSLWLQPRDPLHEENCRVASGNVIFGLLSLVVGAVLIILSIFSLISARRNMMKDTQNCPQCRTTITRQSSPKNCANCGSPIDWANPLKPQK